MLDVKVGDGAFMKTLEEARALAEVMLEIGTHAGREVVCLLTDMSQPLGRAVGNALEIREAVDTIRGDGPADFTELVLDACARLLALSDLGIDLDEGRRRAEAAVADGSALEVYERWIRAQGGDPSLDALEEAPVRAAVRRRVTASSRGVGALAVGHAALELGAGRRTKADPVDHAVGIVCFAKRGDAVRAGDDLAEIHARDDALRPTGSRSGSRRVRDRRQRPAERRASCSTSSPEPCRSSPRSRRSGALLVPVLVGARITRAEIYDARLTRPEDPLLVAAELVGERFSELDRRGKYLLLRMRSGRTLVVHLRMTGSLSHAREASSRPIAYRRALLRLSSGLDVAYRDVRRFGTWLLLEPGEEEAYIAARLGPEPLVPAFTSGVLAAILAGPARPGEGGAARSAQGRGSGEHLRRRGALARPHRSPPPCGHARRERCHEAPPHRPCRPAARGRASGVDAARLRHAGRRDRGDAGRVQGLRSRR